MENFPYQERTIPLKSEDVLLIYSDGITEAMNTKNEEYGEEKLIEVAKDNASLSAADLLKKIIDTVQKHATGEPQSDDITLIIIKKV